MRLLLLSNSTQPGQRYLAHAESAVREHLVGVQTLLFVPYALADHDAYTAKVRDALSPWGIGVRGIHEGDDPVRAVGGAEAVFVGGGNSFRLLHGLQRRGVAAALRDRVVEGMPYMGASAGTNMACPTIRTTNDMPIVEPDSFDALDLVPFQVNPHYLDPDPVSKHMGETREMRLLEFLEENDRVVVGLREGGWLLRDGESLRLHGERAARIFRRGADPEEVAAPADLSRLLR